MSEETREWTNDWYDKDYYKHSPIFNPKGPSTGTKKAQRGNQGALAEADALVFMRLGRIPRALTYILTDEGGIKKAPFPGYSSDTDDNLRCVVNTDKKVN